MHVEDIKIPGQTTLAAKLYLPNEKECFPGVLLCHGFASCKEEFMALPHAICRHNMGVMTFDYSGHGESTGPRAYVSEHSHLDDTLRAYQTLIDRPEIDIESTALVGHSLGTAAVMRFLGTSLAKHVSCAVIMAPMYKTSQSVNLIEKGAYQALSQMSKPFFKLTGRHTYIPYRVKPEDIYLSAEAIERARMIKLLQPTISVHNYPYLMEEVDNVKYAAKVSTPTYVIAAQKDKLIPPMQSQAVYDALPVEDKKWELIENSGHSLLGDRQARLVSGQVIQWLEQHLISAGQQAS